MRITLALLAGVLLGFLLMGEARSADNKTEGCFALSNFYKQSALERDKGVTRTALIDRVLALKMSHAGLKMSIEAINIVYDSKHLNPPMLHGIAYSACMDVMSDPIVKGDL